MTAGCVVLAVAAGACSGSDDAVTTTTAAAPATTTSVPPRPTSTTTTIYDPATVEGQVEAAYLRSWDVYANAVYNLELDEAAFAEVYAEEHLQTKLDEVNGRIKDGRAALVRIEHSYTIQMIDDTTAIVVDQYVNHQVLIDPASKKAVEPDPNEKLTDAVTLRILAEDWHVTRKERVT